MPLRATQIVGAKALLLYLYSLPTSWLFLLPAVVLSARPLGLTPSFVVASFVHLFVSPLLRRQSLPEFDESVWLEGVMPSSR